MKKYFISICVHGKSTSSKFRENNNSLNVTYGLYDPDVVSAVVLLGLALADALRAVARLEREAIVVAVGQRHVGEVH